jgi:CarD family transcriptional regulator, regulator of rRNA transcription
MKLAVGDMVVYGAHGAGPVAARESRVVLGRPQEVVILSLAGGLSVALPMERARALLRPLADEADISRVQEALSSDQAVSADPWPKRQRESLARLADGGPIGLAHIIREGTRREATPSAKGSKSPLSPAERELLIKARRLLSTEIAFARGVDPEDADAWIDQQLRRDP